MAEQWYYAKDDEKRGPVTGARLRELAAAGELSPSDLIWQDGMAEWATALDMEGLFPEGVLPPPLPAAEAGPPPLPRPASASRERRADERTRGQRATEGLDDENTGVATAALVLGIASLVAWIIPIIGFPVSITAVVCGSKGLRTQSRSMATGGLVTGIVGLCLSMLNSLLGAIEGMNSGGYQPPVW
jgi:hypothetical protein